MAWSDWSSWDPQQKSPEQEDPEERTSPGKFKVESKAREEDLRSRQPREGRKARGEP